MRRGIFITRSQPFHLAHKHITNEMDKADDLEEIIIGIGSSQISYTLHDPFTADERERMIRESSFDLKKPYYIIKIPDINNYPKWVEHVESLCPKFDVVYTGGNPNYPDPNKRLFEEKKYEIRTICVDSIARGTLIRKLMIEDGNWPDLVPEGTKKVIYEINCVKRLKELSGIYRNPAVTADIIIDYKDKGIVLIKRKNEPFKNFYALPGGFLDANESIETAAVREAKEETGLEIKDSDIKLLNVYSNPGRDPRGPTVSVAYYVKIDKGGLKAGDDALEAKVFKKIPSKLAFDHNKILEDYFKRK